MRRAKGGAQPGRRPGEHRTMSIALAVVVLCAATAATAEARMRSFHTPSGNIACLYRSGDMAAVLARSPIGLRSSPPALRCDVRSLNDTAFTLDRGHRGKRVHVTDAVPAGRVLAYGSSLRLGPFRCKSRTTGLTCRSRPSGHGFALSRERQRVF